MPSPSQHVLVPVGRRGRRARPTDWPVPLGARAVGGAPVRALGGPGRRRARQRMGARRARRHEALGRPAPSTSTSSATRAQDRVVAGFGERELRAAGGGQGRVRPGQRLPPQPQHQAGHRLRRDAPVPLAFARSTNPGGVGMFVFKAAVVGAGTMGGEIAQVIAAADVPVVLKDVKQEFVDTGLDEGARGHRRASSRPRREGEDHPGAGRRAARADAGPHHRHDRVRGLRRRRLRGRGRAGADGDQAGGVRRARRRHPGPRDPRLQHLVALDLRDGPRHRRARTRSSASTSSTRPR